MIRRFAWLLAAVSVLAACAGDESATTVESSDTTTSSTSTTTTSQPPTDATGSGDEVAGFAWDCAASGGTFASDRSGSETFCLAATTGRGWVETATAGFDPQVGHRVALVLRPGSPGIDDFNALAQACFDVAPACASGRLAIVAGDQVVAAPSVRVPAFERDQIVVTGDYEEAEAAALAGELATADFRSVIAAASTSSE